MGQENLENLCYDVNVPSDDDDDEDDDDNSYDDGDCEIFHFFPICCRDTSNISSSFPTIVEAIDFDRQNNSFDILEFMPSSSDEEFFEKAIVCVNKCRNFILGLKTDQNVGSKLSAYLQAPVNDKSSKEDDDDRFFKPTLSDDAVLMCLDELQHLNSKNVANLENETPDKDTILSLNMQLSALKEQLILAKSCITSLTDDTNMVQVGYKAQDKALKNIDNDGYYFDSYSHHSIHETMLRDFVRTSSYEQAILSNSDTLFKGKNVLDIGCGTGVLSIFAAKAGAKKVIAIDNSDIVTQAQNIVSANGYGDIIICVKGKLEDLIANNKMPLIDGEKIDVIVSEWMGYALFFETMLPSVLLARDKLMSPSGTMYPNGATLFLEGAKDASLEYWDSVHGIDMSSMKKRVGKELCSEATVATVNKDMIVTNRLELIGFNLNTCKDKDLDFTVPFELKPNSQEGETTKIDKVVLSFDIAFDAPNTNPVHFSTGCQSEATHWQQASLWFEPSTAPTLSNDEILRGNLSLTRNVKNPRALDINLIWEVGSNSKGDFVRRCDGWIVSKVGA